MEAGQHSELGEIWVSLYNFIFGFDSIEFFEDET